MEDFFRRYQDIVNVMDDDIREELHGKLAPCSEMLFLREYVARDPGIIAYIQSKHKWIGELLEGGTLELEENGE